MVTQVQSEVSEDQQAPSSSEPVPSADDEPSAAQGPVVDTPEEAEDAIRPVVAETRAASDVDASNANNGASQSMLDNSGIGVITGVQVGQEETRERNQEHEQDSSGVDVPPPDTTLGSLQDGVGEFGENATSHPSLPVVPPSTTDPETFSPADPAAVVSTSPQETQAAAPDQEHLPASVSETQPYEAEMGNIHASQEQAAEAQALALVTSSATPTDVPTGSEALLGSPATTTGIEGIAAAAPASALEESGLGGASAEAGAMEGVMLDPSARPQDHATIMAAAGNPTAAMPGQAMYMYDPFYGQVMYAQEGMVPVHSAMGGGRMVLPMEATAAAAMMEEEPVYVNAKQYHCILRRRHQRAKQEAQNQLVRTRKPYLHESRHNHAQKRMRGPGGRFLTKEEKAALAAGVSYESAVAGASKSEGRIDAPANLSDTPADSS